MSDFYLYDKCQALEHKVDQFEQVLAQVIEELKAANVLKKEKQ